MNTEIHYLYRDAANWKVYNKIIIRGELSFDDLVPHLYQSEYFIPSVVGWSDLQSNDWTEDDHVWHEIVELVITSERETVNQNSDEIVCLFKNANARNWDIFNVWRKKVRV